MRSLIPETTKQKMVNLCTKNDIHKTKQKSQPKISNYVYIPYNNAKHHALLLKAIFELFVREHSTREVTERKKNRFVIPTRAL